MSNDLISRQAAIDAIVNTPTDVYSHDKIVSVLDGAAFRQNEIIDIINELPSAQPERKKGRWYLQHHVWFCDQCGKNPTKGMGYVQGADELFDFCPNCGARMYGERREE